MATHIHRAADVRLNAQYIPIYPVAVIGAGQLPHHRANHQSGWTRLGDVLASRTFARMVLRQ